MGKMPEKKDQKNTGTGAQIKENNAGLRAAPPLWSAALKKTALSLLLIAVVGLLAYANTFNVPFVFDDKGQIEENLMIRDLNNFILALKGHHFDAGDGYIFVPRRYIGYLTFALNYSVGGLNVVGYHIVNIAIHVLNALLVYFLFSLIGKTPRMHPVAAVPVIDRRSSGSVSLHAPLFAALLFVSHPIQTQAVTYIMQRFASLATLFYLLSLVLYSKGRLLFHHRTASAPTENPDMRRLLTPLLFFLLAGGSALLAVLTKEIAFTLPLVVLLYEFTFFKHKLKKAIPLLLAVVIVLAIGSVGIIGASGKNVGALLSDLSEKTRLETDISRGDYLVTQMRVITTYVRLLFIPAGQNLDYDYPVYHSLFTPSVFLSLLFLLSLFLGALYLLRMAQRADQREQSGEPQGDGGPLPSAYYRLIAFGILWFFVTLSVESSVIPIVDVIFEHRVYLPSAGAFIALAASLSLLAGTLRARWKMSERTIVTALSLIIVFLTGTAYARNAVWQDEVTLWEDVVRKSPRKARALNNLAYINASLKRFDVARDLSQKAIELDPNYLDAYCNLANAYTNLGQYTEAFNVSKRALEINPMFSKVHLNLADAYAKSGQYEAAAAAYRRALEIDPNNADIHANLGYILIKMGRYEEAIAACTNALRSNPNLPEAYNNLSSAYRRLKRYDEALAAAQKALTVRPDYATAYNNIGLIYVEMKRPQDAMAAFAKALELAPGYAEAYNNLGGLYLVQGKYDTARDILKKAIAIDPNYINSHMNLGLTYVQLGDREAAMDVYRTLKQISAPAAEQLLAVVKKKG